MRSAHSLDSMHGMCRYDLKTLSLARHDYELEADDKNHVYLDHLHMGVGGDDSWSPSVHQVLPWTNSAQPQDALCLMLLQPCLLLL